MKKHLLFLFAALLPLVASAEKVEIDGIWYNLVPKAKQAEVTSSDGTKYSGSITIPATVTHNGVEYSVTRIGERAFYYCSSLTSITLPEGVTSIGDDAFHGCSRLAAITIPESVVSIGDVAFSGCSSLTDITLPEGVRSIGVGAFSGCSSLTAITIPESVTSIGFEAFWGCSSLTSITIPEGVTSIGDYAFSGCSRLTAITIPEGVTSIGEYTFYGCSSLTSITIPKSVTSIGNSAFRDCSKLTTITIPEGVTSIGSWAFQGCSSLTTIVLPKSVGYIGDEAFADCPELTDVYCYAESVPITKANAFDGSYIEYATLHVPTSAINSYRSTAPWSGFGKFETTSIAVERITLNRSLATLTEGEEMTLTATVEPDDAADTSVTWSSSNPSVATVDNTGKVTAIAPGTATITATANDGSGVSASCEVTVQELILGKCATPTISYVDGKVVLTCETEGAKVITTIAKGDDETREDMEFEYIPAHTLTAYATKEKYEDSDIATLTICWIPCSEAHESEETSILTIPSKPVLISARDGVLTLSGLAEGTEVTLYTTDGVMVAHQQSSAGEATFTVDTNQVYLVHIGDKVVKIGM